VEGQGWGFTLHSNQSGSFLPPTLQNLRRVSTSGLTITNIPLSSNQPVRPELVEARIFFSPTLQNLRQENRVFKRENLSAFHLKDFSFNIKIFSKLCSRMIFASFHQGKEG
jgi:hypothetical protein